MPFGVLPASAARITWHLLSTVARPDREVVRRDQPEIVCVLRQALVQQYGALISIAASNPVLLRIRPGHSRNGGANECGQVTVINGYYLMIALGSQTGRVAVRIIPTSPLRPKGPPRNEPCTFYQGPMPAGRASSQIRQMFCIKGATTEFKRQKRVPRRAMRVAITLRKG